LARDYHPDIIDGKGHPEDFITFAGERFQDIQEAYQAVMEHRKPFGKGP
jgi:DnaJ like chaperone protein